MANYQRQLVFGVLLFSMSATLSLASTKSEISPQFVVITEDVIPDIENKTLKVIRVNPLDLPSHDDTTAGKDSSLIKIQPLRPITNNQRHYLDSSQMRRARPTNVPDTPIIRQSFLSEPKPLKPKKQMTKKQKKLHFFYDQANTLGQDMTKTMQVNVAPGAYPVYYVVSKTNGRFGKFPVKGFRTQAEFMKYLLKSKAEPIERAQRFEI